MKNLLIVLSTMVISGIVASFILISFGHSTNTLFYWVWLILTEVMVGKAAVKALNQ